MGDLLLRSCLCVRLQISKLKRLLVAYNQLELLPEQLGRQQVRNGRCVYVAIRDCGVVIS